jgi:omega-6 fatty acid desaturase (delta-12 desaturase)
MEAKLLQKYKATGADAVNDFLWHTVVFATAVYALMAWKDSYWCALPIGVHVFVLGRTFMVFHDCVHNSYTPYRPVNWLLAQITGIFVLTSPNWFLDHDTHHKTTGNIENSQHYTFNETVASSKHVPRFYWWFRSPLVFFTAVPVLYFAVAQRFVYAVKKIRKPAKFEKPLSRIVLDHAVNNVGVYFYLSAVYRHGILPHYAICLFGFASFAFVTFHNQHSFNPAYVVGNDAWSQRNSGLLGSSFIQVPLPLKYFFMGIEYHHIHHLNSKIPGYNLQLYHEEMVRSTDLFDDVVELSVMDCISNLSLVLYDETQRKYVSR